MKIELVATCLFGLEKMLGEEIDGLGLKRIVKSVGDKSSSVVKAICFTTSCKLLHDSLFFISS